MNADIERQWRKKLEELGPEVVRAKLDPFTIGANADAKVDEIVAYMEGDNEPLSATRKFCEEWLVDKDREVRRHAGQLWWMTAIGAFAAVVAAFAAVLALLSK